MMMVKESGGICGYGKAESMQKDSLASLGKSLAEAEMELQYTIMPAYSWSESIAYLVNRHEHEIMCRYQVASLRFLTYSPGNSRLMKELARECQLRMEQLDQNPMAMRPWPATASFQRSRFFVTDDAMAAQLLKESYLHSQRSQEQYREWALYFFNSRYRNLLEEFFKQKLSECQVLLESQI